MPGILLSHYLGVAPESALQGLWPPLTGSQAGKGRLPTPPPQPEAKARRETVSAPQLFPEAGLIQGGGLAPCP